MKDNDDPFGKSAYEIIADAVKEYNYPVCFGFLAGHQKENKTLILGRKVNLSIGEKPTFNFSVRCLFGQTQNPKQLRNSI